MKTLNKLIFTLAFFALSLSTSVNGNYSNASTMVMMEEGCGVSDVEIRDYLMRHGYQLNSLHPTEFCDKIADTQNEYQTIVYISAGKITGYDDIM